MLLVFRGIVPMMGYLAFFSRFGSVVNAQIQREHPGGKSRGFGFVTFEDPASAEKALSESSLTLDGRRLELKAAVPRGLVGTIETERALKPKKIFVAGLTENVTEADLRDHFSQYGRIAEAVIQKDRQSGVSRGFGFVTFDDGDAVDRVLIKGSQRLGDKCLIDVKIARPKDAPVTSNGPSGASVWGSTFGSGPSWPPAPVNSGSWGPPPPPPPHYGGSSSHYPYGGSPYGGGGSQYGTSQYGSGGTPQYGGPSQYGSGHSGWPTHDSYQQQSGVRPPTGHGAPPSYDQYQYGAYRGGARPRTMPQRSHPYAR